MSKKTMPVCRFGCSLWAPAWIFLGLGLLADAQNLTGNLASTSANIVTNCATPPTGCINATLGISSNVRLLGGSQIVLGPGFKAVATSTSSLTAMIGPPLAITNSGTSTQPFNLPNGNAAAPYSFLFTATGGFAPYIFGWNDTNAPDYLVLSSGGLLGGTPPYTLPTSTLGIWVMDATGAYATGYFALKINGPGTLSGVSCSASGSRIGSPVSFTALPSGSGGPYTYSWSGSVSGGSGSTVSFTPSSGGNYFESVIVSNSSGEGVAQCEATVTGQSGSGPPITAMPSSQVVGPTATASFPITVNAIAGFSGPVNMSVSGLPAGAGFSFSTPINSSGTTTLTVTPSATSPTGAFPIAITALGSSREFTAYTVLNVGQPFPANLLTPAPGAFSGGGSATFTWNAGVGATAYQLQVGSTPGGSDIYSGTPTTLQTATVTLPSTQMVVYATLSSLCGGVWQPSPVTPIPISPISPSGPFPYAAYVPGLSYSVPNDGTPTTLTFCLAGPATNFTACDATDFGFVAPYLQGCSVTDSGYNPVSSATVKGMNPYDPNYPAAFDVTLSLAQTPPGTYHVGCTFWPAEPSGDYVWWQIQVVDGPPVVSFFQQYPANPDGSFYATIWGHNFGPDQGTLQVCIQSGCSGGQMNVCLSAACDNAYYLWSDQQINALIQPGSAPDGTYQWTPCSYGESGTAPICLPVIFLVPFPETSPTAAIYGYNNYFNGQNLSNQTQTVVVGQQIQLIGVSNLPGAFQQAWSVSSSSYVGGYNVVCTPNQDCESPTASQSCLVDQNAMSASNPNGCLPQGTTKLIMDAQTLTIYFTQVPAGPVTVTYALYGQGYNPVAMATTTFNVVGPTGTGVSVFLLKGPAIAPGPPPLLQLGSSKPGIGFQGSATPPTGYAGNFGFVQIVSSASLVYGYPNGTFRTCGGSGLDTTYPYDEFPNPPQTASVYDTPSVQLNSSTYTSQSDFNTFVMFLMWQPDFANSIPVPLGYVNWGWGGLATYTSGAWVLTNAPEAYYTVIQPTTTYPLWSQLNPNPLICGSPQ